MPHTLTLCCSLQCLYLHTQTHARAHTHAHTCTYMHTHARRDVKPNNCLLASDGVLKLADFGLARTLASPERDRARPYTHQVNRKEEAAQAVTASKGWQRCSHEFVGDRAPDHAK